MREIYLLLKSALEAIQGKEEFQVLGRMQQAVCTINGVVDATQHPDWLCAFAFFCPPHTAAL